MALVTSTWEKLLSRPAPAPQWSLQPFVHLQVRESGETRVCSCQVCAVRWAGFWKDDPPFPSSSADGDPEPQKLNCSNSFQRVLPAIAARCWLSAGGGAWSPGPFWHLLPAVWLPAGDNMQGTRQLMGTTLASIVPAMPRHPARPEAQHLGAFSTRAVPGSFVWLLWCGGSNVRAAVVTPNQPERI